MESLSVLPLIEEVAELLPYIKVNYGGYDFNEYKAIGISIFGAAVTGYSNIPDVGSLEGILLVFKGVSSNNLSQIYIGIQDNSFHFRCCYNGDWRSWRRL